MDTLLDLIAYLIIISDVGASARVLYCLIRIMGDPDEAKSYGKKMINLFIFLIFANTALVTMAMVENYFS